VVWGERCVRLPACNVNAISIGSSDLHTHRCALNTQTTKCLDVCSDSPHQATHCMQAMRPNNCAADLRWSCICSRALRCSPRHKSLRRNLPPSRSTTCCHPGHLCRRHTGDSWTSVRRASSSHRYWGLKIKVTGQGQGLQQGYVAVAMMVARSV